MLDELLKLLFEFPCLVVQHHHMRVVSHLLDVVSHRPGQSIQPVVLGKGSLGPNHARYLVEQSVKGTAFSIDQLRAVEVLLDHRWAHNEAMLVHHGFGKIQDTLLRRNGAPVGVLHTTIVGVLLDRADKQLDEQPAAIVGLAKDQFDSLLSGNRYERLQRLVVVAAQETCRGRQGHPAVQQLKDRVGRLVLAAA